MSFILFLLTSGLPGLYSYVQLSSLSIIGEEEPLMKKLYLIAFSFISVLLFTIVFALINWNADLNDLFASIDIIKVLIALVITLIIVTLFNSYLYKRVIKYFRKNMNSIRAENGFTKTLQVSPVNKILDDEDHVIYIERLDYNTNNVLSFGFLKYYSINDEGKLNLVLKNQNKRLNLDASKYKAHIREQLTYFVPADEVNLRIVKLKRIDQSSSSSK